MNIHIHNYTAEKLLFFFCFCFLAIAAVCQVSANETVPETYVIDEADLLTDTEETSLNKTCKEVSMDHHTSICIVTTDDFGSGDIKGWQRSYFEEQDLGIGENNNGLMLAISMEQRDWGIVAFGDAKDTFSSSIREDIGNRILDDLSNDCYYEAFSSYITLSDQYLTNAEDPSYSKSQENEMVKNEDGINPVFIVLVAFLLSFIGSLLIVLSWKAGMNTKVLQDKASDYLEKDSFTLSNRSDTYLYHTVSRTRRQKQKKEFSIDSDHSGSSGKF
ncbi:MAG: TPM domain-containing protein [Lachnospiraceae bacterium]|nr:TPM domain-containing protein [Lachnospiraceae bacterium]